MTERGKPFLYLVIAICAVSCSAVLIRLTHTPPLVIAFYRQIFSALMLLPFVRAESDQTIQRKDYRLLILSGLFLALHFGTWITGLSYTSIARATLFVDLQPVWAAILGAIFLRERLNGIEILAVCVVTLGGILSIVPRWGSGTTTFTGDVLALCGGIAGAGYFLIGRGVRSRISWLRYVFAVYSFSGLWLLIFCVCFYRTLPLPADRDLIWIVLMALVPSLIGHGLFNLAIRKLKAFVVNAAFFGEPVLATMLAYFLFGESPDRYFYFGAGVIFTGLFLLFKSQRE